MHICDSKEGGKSKADCIDECVKGRIITNVNDVEEKTEQNAQQETVAQNGDSDLEHKTENVSNDAQKSEDDTSSLQGRSLNSRQSKSRDPIERLQEIEQQKKQAPSNGLEDCDDSEDEAEPDYPDYPVEPTYREFTLAKE